MILGPRAKEDDQSSTKTVSTISASSDEYAPVKSSQKRANPRRQLSTSKRNRLNTLCNGNAANGFWSRVRGVSLQEMFSFVFFF